MSEEHSDTRGKLAANRDAWSRWTALNYSSDYYDVASFKAGKSSLDEIELAGVGEVRGKRLLHLQCHFGMDTLSWARLGAEVTGIDFSPEAIRQARQLAEELDIEAMFEICSVEDAPGVLGQAGAYDIVFTSYGAISWLDQLTGWAETIAHFLKPGGTFFVADEHPTAWIFDDVDPTPGLRYKYSYFSREALRDEATGNYAQPDAPDRSVTYSWQHTFEEIVNSLLCAGLEITELKEYDCCAWAWFEWMERGDDGLWRMPAEHGDIPLMFSVTAKKPA